MQTKDGKVEAATNESLEVERLRAEVDKEHEMYLRALAGDVHCVAGSTQRNQFRDLLPIESSDKQYMKRHHRRMAASHANSLSVPPRKGRRGCDTTRNDA